MKSYEDLVEENKAMSRAIAELSMALMYANEATVMQEERKNHDPIELLVGKPYRYKYTFVNGNGEEVKFPEHAQVGDTIRVDGSEDMSSALALYHDKQYKVTRDGIRGVYVEIHYTTEMFVPDGHYTIVKRASETERAQIGDTIRDYQGREVVVTEVGEDGTACGSTSATTGSCSELGQYTVIKRADRAQIGDTVQSTEDARIRFVVGYVGSEYAFESPKKALGTWILKHGEYTIVKRADEPQKEELQYAPPGYCSECECHISPDDSYIVKKLGDAVVSTHFKCLTASTQFSTAELVEMLAKREGVEYMHMPKDTTYHNGLHPSRILVVKEDAK